MARVDIIIHATAIAKVAQLGLPCLPALLTNLAKRQDDEFPHSADEWSAARVSQATSAIGTTRTMAVYTTSIKWKAWFWGKGTIDLAIYGGDINIHLPQEMNMNIAHF